MSIKSIDLKFTSANSVPVERAVVTREEWEAVKGLTEELVEALEPLAGVQTKTEHRSSKVVAARALKRYKEVKQ